MYSRLRIEFDSFAKEFKNITDFIVKAETEKGPVTLSFDDEHGRHVFNWDRIVAYHAYK